MGHKEFFVSFLFRAFFEVVQTLVRRRTTSKFSLQYSLGLIRPRTCIEIPLAGCRAPFLAWIGQKTLV